MDTQGMKDEAQLIGFQNVRIQHSLSGNILHGWNINHRSYGLSNKNSSSGCGKTLYEQ